MPRQKSVLRKICRYSSYLISTVVLLLILLAASAGIPAYLSTSHEEIYFTELDRVQKFEQEWTDYADSNKTENARWRKLFNTPPEIPYNKRLLPLIHDIPQLRSTTWLNQLGLSKNLPAPYPLQKTWVYIGGTPRSLEPLWKRLLRKFTITSLPRPSCIDPPYICNGFNNAFNKLIEYYHTHRHHPYVELGSNLAFIDCDNSPFICNFVHMDPPVLLYLETQGESERRIFQVSIKSVGRNGNLFLYLCKKCRLARECKHYFLDSKSPSFLARSSNCIQCSVSPVQQIRLI